MDTLARAWTEEQKKKHPKWPAGTEGGKGGKFAPKLSGPELGPELTSDADYEYQPGSLSGYQVYDAWLATDSATTPRFHPDDGELKAEVVESLAGAIEARGWDWVAENTADLECEFLLVPPRYRHPPRYVPEGELTEWSRMSRDERLRAFGKASESNRRLLLRAFVDRFIDGWAEGGNGWDMHVIQQAAADEFGLDDAQGRLFQTGYGNAVLFPDPVENPRPSSIDEKMRVTYKAKGAPGSVFARALLRTMYDMTQQRLAAAGYKPGQSILVMRVVGGLPEPVMHTGVRRIRSNPLSSWTHSGIAVDEFRDYVEDPHIVVARVPLSRVLCTPYTGIGCQREDEWVVIGGNGTAYVADEATWAADNDEGGEEEYRAARDFDPTKHPKYPAGTEGGKGGQWAPKGMAVVAGPADYPAIANPDEGDAGSVNEYAAFEATRVELGPRPSGMRRLDDKDARVKDKVTRDIADAIEAEKGLDWLAELTPAMPVPYGLYFMDVDWWNGWPRDDPAPFRILSVDDQRNLLREWVATSLAVWAEGGRGRDMGVLQAAADEEFGLGQWPVYAGDFDFPAHTKRPQDESDVTWVKSKDFARALLRAMYDTTQKRLAAAGYKPTDFLILHRGITQEPFRTISGRRVRSHPLSAWSHELDQATAFALGGYGMGGENRGGVLLESRIPVGRILSTPYSGLGCLDEGEWVVIGATGTAHTHYPEDDAYDAAEDSLWKPEPNYSPLDQ